MIWARRVLPDAGKPHIMMSAILLCVLPLALVFFFKLFLCVFNSRQLIPLREMKTKGKS
jgi:hypothetical protein